MTALTAALSAAAIAERLGRPLPTEEQTAVIEAPVAPMLVVAGAGSGKTETMSSRVVWLVANGLVQSEEVLGLTFTRKAAGELAERVRRRLRMLRARGLGGAGAHDLDAGEPTIATYNSYAASLVADHGLRLGVEPQSTVLTEAGAWQLATEVVEGWRGDLGEVDLAPDSVTRAVLGLAGECAEHLLEPQDVAAWIDRALAHVLRLPRDDRSAAKLGAHVAGEPYAKVREVLAGLRTRRALVPLLEEYARRKAEREQLDFGDQVRLAARLAQEVRLVGVGERTRFRVVLLDEYQDTSHAQLVLLRSLFGDGHAVTAVGDPNQSIYGWRGASAGNLQSFPAHFPRADGTPAAVAPLSTSWRNDAAVLAVANVAAAPLSGGGVVPPLRARPGAGPGLVRTAFLPTVEEEAAHVAARLAEVWAADTAALADGRRAERRSAAVLCRKRSQFVPLQRALRAAGLPVQVGGLGGLLSTPEVADLVSALHVLHDPSRGDHLVRLLTGARWRIGPRDLELLARWAVELDRLHVSRPDERAGADADVLLPDTSDGASLVEALDVLPRPAWTAPDGRRFSAEGRRRMDVLSRTLRHLRTRTHQALPDLVGEVERALLLDVEVAARPGTAPGSDRAHLDAFADAAASFAATAQRPTLGGLLAWLDAARARERGLEPGAVEVDPNAVQLLTVHASKGLEWDVVAVPGLVEGVLPAAADTASGWLGDAGAVPFPLRGDRAHLPSWGLRTAGTQKELEEAREEFRQACGAHEMAEERRLAYVAFTRAREELLLSGAWWDEPASPREPSRFLLELLAVPPEELPGLVSLPPAPRPQPGTPNPRTAEPQRVVWPVDPLAARRDEVERGAAQVRAAARSGHPDVLPEADPGTDPGTEHPGTGGRGAGDDGVAEVREWARQAELLLAERVAGSGPQEVLLPQHLSASRLVALAEDPQALALALRRPMPAAPRPQTRRGTAFHAWLERRFRAGALLDLEELPGAADEDAADDAELARLQDGFLASEWASRDPVAVEVAVETPVAGVVVRGRIDAVFRTEDADGTVRYDVVDWKTGRPPEGERARVRDVQLAVYRLAWSRLHGLPPENVSAAFFYASTGETVRPVDLLDAAALEALVATVPAGPD
ncbi:DNA helicase-2/ATP-dependent DNA helicase PcrA [Kineococcus xinjiangensis]|uniref:DNA 3'-5' helicase n=1 Tax=Kineococcus xinjiangensis TaxID=512762 RepID=A0A2S6IWQ4_9ACTN|nr:ATP-dependent DNA helicase [Kineococcus xinjiangensis]PPK98763.1 DNA helicase-2/ATP-dependent DNA helicase PcrA [Kineococcus xinjiangensis]